MDIIQLLPDHIANQIAAGEVIQRPASAVKEMLENALDSGATSIKLFIKDSGKTLIQVVDNGCGMSETDARMSFERHATSKIRKADDLFNIKTMGFRGEAMASMAAIAHVELCTKLTNEELGTKIVIEGSDIKKQEETICANGTSVKIKNLFYNVPARRNFLKSDKIETKHIIDQFSRVALANPEIAWILFLDNKEYYHLDSSNFRQRIVNIIGGKINEKLVPIEEETNLVKISGFIGKPEAAKKTRGEQYFFVNGRFIKSYYLNHAISKAFTDLIADNYHPSYFINLEINPKMVDINIHPTKTEIKFENEQAIYAILRSSVKKSLGKYNIAPTLDFNTEPNFDIPIKMQNTTASEPKIKVNSNYNPFTENSEPETKDTNNLYQNNFEEEIQTEINLSEIENNSSDLFQLNNQFIVSKSEEGLILINQQRAHQRILYEYYKENLNSNLPSQQLIFPTKLDFSKSEIEEIRHIENKLNKFGFHIEIENNKLEVLSVPPQCTEENLQVLFNDFLKETELNDTDLKEKIETKISKILSTKTGIKSGQKLQKEEMQMIVSKLMKCEIPSVSPFGQSCFFNISLTDITKKLN